MFLNLKDAFFSNVYLKLYVQLPRSVQSTTENPNFINWQQPPNSRQTHFHVPESMPRTSRRMQKYSIPHEQPNN